MPNETRELASFAADLTYERIPAPIRARAINLIIDQLGVQIGCSDLPWARQVYKGHKRTGGTPEATVVRYGDRLPIGAAAFINSTFGHSFEFDDANMLAHGHPGAELIPPLLALAEREHTSGRDFLTAFIAAYEVRGHIGWALAPDLNHKGGPQYSTTCGPFGVAAGAGKLLKLGEDGIRNALGIAGCFCGGLMQYDHGGGSAKRLFTAIAGSNGLHAVQLAQSGITGPEEILEGAHGLLKIFPANYRAEKLVAGLGTKWLLEHATLKPYSCVAVLHPAIDGVKNIMAANALSAADIESITVSYAKASFRHAAIKAPSDLLGMQFSTYYSLALTALKGKNTPSVYTAEALADPAVRDFASRVHLKEDAELDKLFEGHRPARVELRTVSGKVHEEFVMDAKGSPGNPLSQDDVDEKFSSQVADVLGGETCLKLLDVLRHIDTLDDVSALTRLLVEA